MTDTNSVSDSKGHQISEPLIDSSAADGGFGLLKEDLR